MIWLHLNGFRLVCHTAVVVVVIIRNASLGGTGKAVPAGCAVAVESEACEGERDGEENAMRVLVE